MVQCTMTFKKNDADMNIMFAKERSARSNYSQKIRAKEDTKEDFYEKDDSTKKT